MGKVRDMTINPAKGTQETFGKFISNSIGDPFVDPGKYHLRQPSAPLSKNFRQSGCNKLTRHSEF